MTTEPGLSPLWRDVWIGAGLLALGLALYLLTGPGRLDMTDGQWRFEVALGLVEEGRPVVRDPILERGSLPGRDGLRYSAYGAAGSVAGAPLVWLGTQLAEPAGELQRFLFSHTSAFFAALLLVVLYRFYRDLEIGHRAAVGWTLAAGFATLIWPLATSTFDQVQHALLVLAALWLAHRAAGRQSLALAAAGGAIAGLLLSYQEVYAILLPAIAIACRRAPGEEPPAAGRRRSLAFLTVAIVVGLTLVLAYNSWRFADPFFSGKLVRSPGHPSPLGFPPAGLWGLLASPGKGAFFYSPPLLLAALGLPGLWRRRRRLAQAVLVLVAAQLTLVSSLSFWSGEWSWGPRYLVPLIAPLALAFPRLPAGPLRRPLTAVAIGLGLAVQLLALSLDHQRFFFERRLSPYFWNHNAGFYLEHSQLRARPFEILATLRGGPAPPPRVFQPTPYPESITYCIFGSREARDDPHWVDRFQVFRLPRPWPLWMPHVDRDRYRLPVPPYRLAAVLLLLAAAGTAAICGGLANSPGAKRG